MRTQGKRGLKASLLIGLLLFAKPTYASVFFPQTATLANGMTVILVQNKLSPAVAQMVWYRVGAADDPAGRSGLAHYLEHMMFKGTRTVPDGALSETVAAQGGEDNAYTSYDYTTYYEIVAASQLPLMMQLEADRMRGLLFDSEKAASELSVVKSERQQRTDNHPQGLFAEKMRAALFPAHPYGRPIIGWREDIAQLTPRDAHAFYQHFYAPQNAILVISGNVTMADVLASAAATFGRVEGGKAIQRPPLPSLPHIKNERLEMKDERVTQTSVAAQTLVPSRGINAMRSYALEVLAEILGGGEVGLLYRRFVLETKTASGVSVSYDPIARGSSVFSWGAIPAGDGDVRALESQMKTWLAQKAKKGFSGQDVTRAKERLESAAIFARDRLLVPAQITGEALAVGLSVEEVEAWPQRIHTVTAAQVNAAFRDVMQQKGWVTGILEPALLVKKGGEE